MCSFTNINVLVLRKQTTETWFPNINGVWRKQTSVASTNVLECFLYVLQTMKFDKYKCFMFGFLFFAKNVFEMKIGLQTRFANQRF